MSPAAGTDVEADFAEADGSTGPDPEPRGAHPANVHLAKTFLLPGARQWDDKPTVALGGATRIDALRPFHSGSDADQGTAPVAPKIPSAQPPVAPEPSSSDPPTRRISRLAQIEPPPASIVQNEFDLEKPTIARDGEPPIAALRPFYTGTDSEEGTAAVAPPIRAAQPPVPTGPSSSDPPTSSRRIFRDDHIDLPPGSIVNDEFEIDAKLGAGAMGEVYAARHIKLGKRVALKVIAPRLSEDAAAVERFEQEARALAQIHHPGIVAVDHVGELADGRSYFVMEYLAGEPLDARLLRGRLPFDEALDIMDQIARALDAAHVHGVTHRDLKPGNMFLARVTNEPRPIVKLLDFGLAKLAADVDRRLEKTQAGVMLGTALYISPEQAHGMNVDHRTDIYALGVVAYELLLGRPPFHHAKTMAALIAAHLHEWPPMPRSIWPDIPPQLDLLLFGLLAKDPAHRPTLAQVRHVIASVRAPAPMSRMQTHTDAGDYDRPPPPATAPRLSRLGMVAIAGAAMIAGIAIGAAALGSGSGGGTQEPTLVTSPPAHERGDAGGSLVAITPSTVTPSIDAPADKVADQAPPIDEAIDFSVPDPHAVDPPLAAPPIDATPASPPDAAAPPATTTVVKPRPTVVKPRVTEYGTLSLTSKPFPCEILVDNKPIGRRTPQPEITLPAGRHRITLLNDRYTINDTFTVQIRARETETRSKDYSGVMVEKPARGSARPDGARKPDATIDPFKKKKGAP